MTQKICSISWETWSRPEPHASSHVSITRCLRMSDVSQCSLGRNEKFLSKCLLKIISDRARWNERGKRVHWVSVPAPERQQCLHFNRSNHCKQSDVMHHECELHITWLDSTTTLTSSEDINPAGQACTPPGAAVWWRDPWSLALLLFSPRCSEVQAGKCAEAD